MFMIKGCSGSMLETSLSLAKMAVKSPQLHNLLSHRCCNLGLGAGMVTPAAVSVSRCVAVIGTVFLSGEPRHWEPTLSILTLCLLCSPDCHSVCLGSCGIFLAPLPLPPLLRF